MISEWAGLAAAGGLGGLIAAIVHFATFFLNRGRAESAALAAAIAAQRTTDDLRTSLTALSGVFYLFRDKVADDAKNYVNREMLRDMEERVLRQVDSLAHIQSEGLRTVHARLDEMLRILTAPRGHGDH